MTQTIEPGQSGEQGKTGRWAKAVERHENPKGIQSISPGLRGTSYPGCGLGGTSTPEGAAHRTPKMTNDKLQMPAGRQEAVTNFGKRFPQNFPEKSGLASAA